MAPRLRRSLLIDGNNLLYWGYDSTCQQLRHSDGIQIGAAVKFITRIERFLTKFQPHVLIVAFDTPRRNRQASSSTWRRRADASYKQDRAKTPRGLLPQFHLSKQLAQYAGANVISVEGIEADDLLASYASGFYDAPLADQVWQTTIVSDDGDFTQLVRDPVDQDPGERLIQLYQPRRRRVIDATRIEKRFGIPPELYADYRALLCSKSPAGVYGIPRIDASTVVELLREHQSLRSIFRNIQSIEDPALQELIKRNISVLERQRRLTTLCRTIELPIAIDELQMLAPLPEASVPGNSILKQEQIVELLS